MFALESPHRVDSNEYTYYTIFNYKTENHFKLSLICSYGIFSKGLQNEFETAVLKEPSVFSHGRSTKLFLSQQIQLTTKCLGTNAFVVKRVHCMTEIQVKRI